MPRAPHPLLIIGLDGATFDVLDPLIARGALPNLARLAATGLRSELRSTMPPATQPAWTSFLTAAQPARHGVTNIFLRGGAGGYGLRPANAGDRLLPTFLATLSGAGYRVASLGIPGTHPPEPINGICIAGFDAPGQSRAQPSAVWPPALHREVDRLGGWRYAVFNELARGGEPRARMRRIVAALLGDIARKERIVDELYRREPWDLFCVHIQATDTAGHHLWHLADEHSPRHVDLGAEGRDGIASVYQRVDELIGRLIGAAPNRGRTLVISDHGMGGASNVAVYVNRWLHNNGWLRFAGAPARRLRRATRGILRRGLDHASPAMVGAALRALPRSAVGPLLELSRGAGIAFGASLAFSDELDYSPSIWLNDRAHFGAGVLDANEVHAAREAIASGLTRLIDPRSGARLVRRVLRREELGDGAARMPDLSLEPAWPAGYRASFVSSDGPGAAVCTVPPAESWGAKGGGMPGVHRREGIFVACGAGLRATEIPALTIPEAGALVFRLLGIVPPVQLEVELPDWIDEVVLQPANGATAATASTAPMAAITGAAVDQRSVIERLRSLGYLE